MMNASRFLESKLPKPGKQTPLGPKYKPSEAEISKWHDYFSIVEDPIKALDQVAAGNLTGQTMETLQVVYPKLLQEMQHKITEKMIDHINKNKPIPYKTKLSLSLFLDQDLVPSLDPISIAGTQATLNAASAANDAMKNAQMSSVSTNRASKLKEANRMLTPMQKSAQREGA
jgi:hypothetical protein